MPRRIGSLPNRGAPPQCPVSIDSPRSSRVLSMLGLNMFRLVSHFRYVSTYFDMFLCILVSPQPAARGNYACSGMLNATPTSSVACQVSRARRQVQHMSRRTVFGTGRMVSRQSSNVSTRRDLSVAESAFWPRFPHVYTLWFTYDVR